MLFHKAQSIERQFSSCHIATGINCEVIIYDAFFPVQFNYHKCLWHIFIGVIVEAIFICHLNQMLFLNQYTHTTWRNVGLSLQFNTYLLLHLTDPYPVEDIPGIPLGMNLFRFPCDIRPQRQHLFHAASLYLLLHFV